MIRILYGVSYPLSWKKLQNITNLFDLLLAIIVDSGWQNAHADPEVVCCTVYVPLM